MRSTPLLVWIIAIITLMASFSAIPVACAEETVDTAEIAVTITDDTIPQIQEEWTSINFTIEDVFGLNWDYLKDAFPFWYMKIVWPYMFGLKDIDRYLGYTSVSLYPEIISSYSDHGWAAKMEPSTLDKTTQGHLHNVTLKVKRIALASDYSPTVRIRCIRYDVLGGEYGTTYITIPVKAAPSNYASVLANDVLKEASPHSIVEYEIDITNQGEYKDTYCFGIRGENGTKGVIAEQSVVLESRETATIHLSILTPDITFDPGTPRRVNISIYPLKNPSSTIETSVIVITQGMYINPQIYFTAGVTITIILIALFLTHLLLKRFNKDLHKRIFGKRQKKTMKKLAKIETIKPNKPWTIPAEKKHLESLKKKDKKKHEAEMKMMEQEYQSAILWYDSYLMSLKREQKEAIRKAKSEYKKQRLEEKEKKEQKKKAKTLPSKINEGKTTATRSKSTRKHLLFKKKKDDSKDDLKKDDGTSQKKSSSKIKAISKKGSKKTGNAPKDSAKKSVKKAEAKKKAPIKKKTSATGQQDALERIKRQQKRR